MAQFVTHIQPTLIEASHHHIPHTPHHKDHHGKDHHGKDHHGKEKDHHGKERDHYGPSKSPHRGTPTHSLHEYHPGHPPLPYPCLPPTPEHHHHMHEPGSKRNSGHYESHGIPHPSELHYIDSHGVHRIYHAIDDEHDHGEKDKHHHHKKKDSRDEKMPIKEDGTRPTPPQFINITPVHLENKLHVSITFLYLKIYLNKGRL